MPIASTRGVENVAAILQIKANQLISHAENDTGSPAKWHCVIPIVQCQCLTPADAHLHSTSHSKNQPARGFRAGIHRRYSQRTSFFVFVISA